MKRLLLGAIALISIVLGIGSYVFSKKASTPDAMLSFIKENPERASLHYIRNGEVAATSHSEQMMPLASAVKTVLAIEYAKQSAEGKMNPKESVPLKELEKYYLPNLDGGAHPAWRKSVEEGGVAKNGAVPLEEVAKGMIQYSSNANTEYLMEKLGRDRLEQVLAELELRHHESIYPFVSSLLLPYEIMSSDYLGLSEKEALPKVKEKMRSMSAEEWREHAWRIHEKLSKDKDGSYKKQAEIEKWYDSELDKMNSDRFPAATAKEYAELMQKINSRSYFSKEVQQYLHPVMEGIMQNPANQQWLLHAGKKGGSTAYILTDAMYATDKQGAKTELAVFFNDLQAKESDRLTAALNEFELLLLRDEKFRQKVIEELKQK
ncbi:serine hydrolase [Aneurinibacillus migulanus]|uniref:D-alanyl-D-alanine carboxypeptidase n=1 Tax=Aneurinibacillus migulanus TaxID=47500 RepID=A0A0D1VHS3_ANEMI|nr:serine hydrolase [Aneurinibacillus migulanus]KIV59009.1 hypothetical protein TS65_03500 [Aneurinibacillus migulanus]KON99286.1 hypothetical protein AF333_00680 [Aneurinibacillus migulanus]MED0893277.1 serine hydrolase [Aneurinibacillus migulanus]MED1615418.1 serine hydrolase [Aneurinibacillus migulanus]MED4727601.1 serine hydrolase [Aneurinibacillus migulanus]